MQRGESVCRDHGGNTSTILQSHTGGCWGLDIKRSPPRNSAARAGAATGMAFWGKANQAKLLQAADPTSCWVPNRSLGKEEPSEEPCLEAKSIGAREGKT